MSAPGRGLPRPLSPDGWPGWAPTTAVVWTKIIAFADLPTRTKAVALMLAADWQTKTGITRPGVTRMAAAAGLKPRSVLYALADLEGFGLIFCKERGSKGGRSGKASVYLLTAHARIAEFALPGFSMPHVKEVEARLGRSNAA